MNAGPLSLYRQQIEAGDLTPDPVQEKAVQALDDLYDRLISQKSHGSAGGVFDFFRMFFSSAKNEPGIKGLYMHGGVGRGKSMLMDLFFDSLQDQEKIRRIHFHEFMIETHDWLHQARQTKEDHILPAYAKYVAKNLRVLCFDEFHVTNVADAMILARLFTALFEKGVVVVATSNWVPDRLYEGGLQRDRFLPFIDLLKQQMNVLHLDSPTDYRLQKGGSRERYFYPLGKGTTQKADDLFAGLTDCVLPAPGEVEVKGRKIISDKTVNGTARFSFAQLCEQPHGAEDYMAIARAFPTIFLEGVPKLGYDRRNEAKRLMTLIDALYEAGTNLVVTADAPPEKLYQGHDHAFEFDRTVSRLVEMGGR